MRRKHETRSVIHFMKGKTYQQPNFRLFRSLRTLQGLDYIQCLRGLKSVEFWDFAKWLEMGARGKYYLVRDFTFIMDVNNAVRRPKTDHESYLSQLRNLAPLLPGHEAQEEDWQILEKFVSTNANEKTGHQSGSPGPNNEQQSSDSDSSSASDPDSDTDMDSGDDSDAQSQEDPAELEVLHGQDLKSSSQSVYSTMTAGAVSALGNLCLQDEDITDSDADNDGDADDDSDDCDSDDGSTIVPEDSSTDCIDLTGNEEEQRYPGSREESPLFVESDDDSNSHRQSSEESLDSSHSYNMSNQHLSQTRHSESPLFVTAGLDRPTTVAPSTEGRSTWSYAQSVAPSESKVVIDLTIDTDEFVDKFLYRPAVTDASKRPFSSVKEENEPEPKRCRTSLTPTQTSVPP